MCLPNTLMMRNTRQHNALLDPTQGNVATQFLEREVARLAPIENCLHDIGREEGAAENLSNISLRQAGMLR